MLFAEIIVGKKVWLGRYAYASASPGIDVLVSSHNLNQGWLIHGSYRNVWMKFNDFPMTFQGRFKQSRQELSSKKVTKWTLIYPDSWGLRHTDVLLWPIYK